MFLLMMKMAKSVPFSDIALCYCFFDRIFATSFDSWFGLWQIKPKRNDNLMLVFALSFFLVASEPDQLTY
jgi:hypothetical protein